jgi:hypothetical protein
MACASGVVLWAHRGNMAKLFHGQESRFTVKTAEQLREERKRRVPPTRRRDGRSGE